MNGLVCKAHSNKRVIHYWCPECVKNVIQAERDRYEAAVREVLDEWCANGIQHEIVDLNIPDVMADIEKRLESK